ncbi:RPP21 protein, partial [Polyodon spathula]|nr:RPP21 protein [Polyodon spathula]
MAICYCEDYPLQQEVGGTPLPPSEQGPNRAAFLYMVRKAAHCVLAQNPDNVELARFYCHTQRTISRRLVLRQDPSVKRTVCKKCWSLLVPGVTATVRQRKCNRRQRLTVVRCLSCGQTKRFRNDPEYQLWVERPEALLQNQPKPAVWNQLSVILGLPKQELPSAVQHSNPVITEFRGQARSPPTPQALHNTPSPQLKMSCIQGIWLF